MGMADDFDDIFGKVIQRDFDRIGPELITEAQRLISIRVGKSRGKKIRSKPGEPPRYDSGELSQSLGYEVDRSEDGPTLIIFCHIKGLWLEEKFDRPFLSTVVDRFMDDLDDRFLVVY
jgi:hypothetical protein